VLDVVGALWISLRRGFNASVSYSFSFLFSSAWLLFISGGSCDCLILGPYFFTSRLPIRYRRYLLLISRLPRYCTYVCESQSVPKFCFTCNMPAYFKNTTSNYTGLSQK
jgi:hypothetical protein